MGIVWVIEGLDFFPEMELVFSFVSDGECSPEPEQLMVVHMVWCQKVPLKCIYVWHRIEATELPPGFSVHNGSLYSFPYTVHRISLLAFVLTTFLVNDSFELRTPPRCAIHTLQLPAFSRY